MEIASFVKNIADTHRYGIDCIIDTDNLLALALSKMPIACIEPMESCNDATNTNTVTTITCEGGNITLDGQTVTTSHVLNQVNVFGKGVIINNPELKRNGTFSASVKGVGLILSPKLTRISGTTVITDIDGNTYNFVTIGDYDWFTSNLKVTRLNDNTALTIHNTPSSNPYTINNFDNLWLWSNSTDATLYSWYDNNVGYKDIRGALYNKASAMNPKICPVGWRVPTYQELNNMVISYNEKIRGTTLWTTIPNVPVSNGFNLIPNGYKLASSPTPRPITTYNGKYYDLNEVASLWTTSLDENRDTQIIQLDYNSKILVRPNINQPSSIPQLITDFTTVNGRGTYNGSTFFPYYAPTGNCIRCMRNKIN
jgi:uncharacterized protein (TIGR02145 family)